MLVPGDMLDAFAPWTMPSSVRPANGLLGDLVQQMYPWRVFAHAEIAVGRFPLWNPHVGGGTPLFANGQSALLFPLNVAVLWLPPEVAATAVQLAKPPLAAIGVALFLRALGIGGLGCVVAGLAWAFSGPMVAWLGWPHTNALLVVPFCFWTATRWLQTGALNWWLSHSAAVGVQLLGGHPETTAHTLVALGVFVVVWLAGDVAPGIGPFWRTTLRKFVTHGSAGASPPPSPSPVEGEGRKPPPPLRGRVGVGGNELLRFGTSNPLVRVLSRGIGWGGAVAAGAALAGVQVIPLLAAISDSITAAERDARSLAGLTLEAPTALTWIVPSFFGTPLAQTFGALNFLNYNETLGYVGLGTLAAAAVSFASPARRGWAGVLALTLIAVGLTYGLPVLTELRRLPGLSHAANTRFVFFVAFGLACLAGIGIDAMVRRRRSLVPYVGIALCGALGVGVAGLALSPNLLTPSVDSAAPLTPLGAAMVRQQELWKAAGIAGAWAIVFIFVAFGRRAAPARWAGAGLVVAVLALDLLLFGSRYNPIVPPETLRRVPDAVAFVRERDPGGRVIGLGEALLPNTAMLFGLNDLRVYEPVADRRVLSYFERIDPTLESDIRSRFYLFVWHPDVPMLSLAGVRWVLSPAVDARVAPEHTLANAGLVMRYRDRVAAVWENPFARPRAYLSDSWEEVVDARPALAAVARSSGPQGGSSVVEQRLVASSGAQRPRDNQGTGESTALGELKPGPGDVEASFSPGRVEIHFRAARPSLLVVNDAYYAGWQAWVDGHGTDVVHANYLFMGVAVPAGEHSVTLEYRPAAVPLGVGVTAGALLALGSLAVVARRRAVRAAARRPPG